LEQMPPPKSSSRAQYLRLSGRNARVRLFPASSKTSRHPPLRVHHSSSISVLAHKLAGILELPASWSAPQGSHRHRPAFFCRSSSLLSMVSKYQGRSCKALLQYWVVSSPGRRLGLSEKWQLVARDLQRQE